MILMTRQPVAVVGGSKQKPGADAYNAAREIGVGLASRGVPVICGGRTGVMEAVCEGCKSVGGLSIGVLPELDMGRANFQCTIVLPTDLGNADGAIVREGYGFPRVSRNRVIVRSAFCVFVVNGTREGTADEVRFAHEFKLRCFGLCDPAVPPQLSDIWRSGGLFSLHGSSADALAAFDRDFPEYSQVFSPTAL
jgi:hypothetical protein